jgi:hypothetical protein
MTFGSESVGKERHSVLNLIFFFAAQKPKEI